MLPDRICVVAVKEPECRAVPGIATEPESQNLNTEQIEKTEDHMACEERNGDEGGRASGVIQTSGLDIRTKCTGIFVGVGSS